MSNLPAQQWGTPQVSPANDKTLSRRERRAAAREEARRIEEVKAQIKQWKKHAKPSFKVGYLSAEVYVWEDRVANRKTGGVFPLQGVKVECESPYSVSQRFTVSRVAMTGPFALFMPKQVDKGHSYITFTGPNFQWTIDMGEGPALRKQAQKLANQISTFIGERQQG